MAFNSVTITPTLDTSAYADGDVLFAGTEIQMPHRACKLISAQAVWDDTQAPDEQIGLYFFAENTNALGTLNAVPSITAAQMHANGFLGYAVLANSQHIETELGTPTIFSTNTFQGDTSSEHSSRLPIVLVAGKGVDTKPTSIFVQGLLEVSGGITCTADSLKIIFHFEY